MSQYASYSGYVGGSGGGGSGVSSLNGLTGAVTLSAGSNITLTPVGNDIEISASGGGGANTSLSNLVAPTAVNETLLPSGGSSLGALGNPWNLISGKFLSLSNNAGSGPSFTIQNDGGENFDIDAQVGDISIYTPQLFSITGVTGINFSTSGSIQAGSVNIKSVADPVDPQDAATKAYVDSSAGGITQLTGDVTAGPGSGSQAATLATVNSNVGSFGSSTSIPSFTVNGKGLITAASGNVVVAPAGTLSGTTLNATVVSSSLTSVGTITTGVWNGTDIAVADGGTGLSTLTANNVILGNGTSTPLFVAPGSSGNVLTSNGTTWTSAAPASGGANTALSNLTTTSINQDLIPNADNSFNLGSASAKWLEIYASDLFAYEAVHVRTTAGASRINIFGNSVTSPSGNSAPTIYQNGGPSATASEADFTIATGSGMGDDPTGTLRLESGNITAGDGDSGNISLQTGSVDTGDRGKIVFKDGSEGTAGHVWTSSTTGGAGGWAAPASLASIQVSSSSGLFTTTAGPDPVTNLSLNVVSSSSSIPVSLWLQSDGSGNDSYVGPGGALASFQTAKVLILRNGTEIGREIVQVATTAFGSYSLIPVGSIRFTDISPPVGTNTYSIELEAATTTATIAYAVLCARAM